MKKSIDDIEELIIQLDKVGRNEETGYELDKISIISKKVITVLNSLDDLDNQLKKESINELNEVINSINDTNKKDYMDLVRKTTSPIVSILSFYGIEFY